MVKGEILHSPSAEKVHTYLAILLSCACCTLLQIHCASCTAMTCSSASTCHTGSSSSQTSSSSASAAASSYALDGACSRSKETRDVYVRPLAPAICLNDLRQAGYVPTNSLRRNNRSWFDVEALVPRPSSEFTCELDLKQPTSIAPTASPSSGPSMKPIVLGAHLVVQVFSAVLTQVLSPDWDKDGCPVSTNSLKYFLKVDLSVTNMGGSEFSPAA
eukprot:gene30106-39302_t